MRTKIIRYIIVVLAATLVVSCQKSDIPTYDNTYDAIRFPVSNLLSSEDKGYDASAGVFRTSYSFIGDPFAEYVVYDIPLVLVGSQSQTDRKVNYQIDTGRSYSPPGSYEILESVVPADSHAGYIRIKLYNLEELDEEVYELYITLEESEGLSLIPAKYTSAVMTWHNNLPAPTLNTQIRTYNYLIVSPASYNSTSLPYFSPNALKAIVDAFGWNDWDDYEIHGPSYNSNGYKYLPRSTVLSSNNSYKSYAAKLGAYIKAHNEAHPDAPLLHNAGEQKGEPIEARFYDN